eukprot:5938423-Lingulodinium_polyedra.AAC.1
MPIAPFALEDSQSRRLAVRRVAKQGLSALAQQFRQAGECSNDSCVRALVPAAVPHQVKYAKGAHDVHCRKLH